ncbi:MAG: SIMPL domain-containing protein, partial [Salinirussus sp.]
MTSSRAILLAALLVAGLAGAAGSVLAVDGAAPSADNQTITVTGSGEIDVSPDAAVVRLAVTGSAPTASNASEQVATDAATLRSRMAELGISNDNVRSVGYDVHKQDERRPDAEGTHYVATQRFEVTLENVERAGTIIDAALGSGADEVHGVSFTLSESAREEARGEA